MSLPKGESYDFDRHEDRVRLPMIPPLPGVAIEPYMPSEAEMAAVEALLGEVEPIADMTPEVKERIWQKILEGISQESEQGEIVD